MRSSTGWRPACCATSGPTCRHRTRQSGATHQRSPRTPRLVRALNIQGDYRLDRAPAHSAECGVTREHDAIDLGPIIAGGFVVGAFERAHFAEILLSREQLHLERTRFAKERLHFLL